MQLGETLRNRNLSLLVYLSLDPLKIPPSLFHFYLLRPFIVVLVEHFLPHVHPMLTTSTGTSFERKFMMLPRRIE
ncbi:hypothetical protein HT576_16420 [Haloterrigena sp. SYSU A121-1]|uniref:Uncharacterized protein n=1 Tax=Haloterrigena gelatinilytica TaxID=2741724 RepID=A0A8J8KFQ6_9EURY|nr:hypothetical protein [Haloterrigena gelatinilytica]NUB92593.1 hypothetical protein [Haloterrigena gelatinilytica]